MLATPAGALDVSRLEDLGAWPARVAWVLVALLAPVVVGGALDGRSAAVRLVVAVGLWAGWAGGLVALLVPRSAALTALRTVVPAGLAAVLVAVAVDGEADVVALAAVAAAAVATVGVLVPWVGEAWVDGSSYGPERRLPLRPPAAFTYVLVPATWTVVLLGVATGPLLLAAERWLAGGIALVVGGAAAAAGVRSLHQLSRRWIVLVPTGIVVHDPIALPEPHLFLRASVAGLGPVPVDEVADAVDLTAGAPGLALRLALAEPVELLLWERRRTTGTRSATAILVTPSRPAHLLELAAAHRLPVG